MEERNLWNIRNHPLKSMMNQKDQAVASSKEQEKEENQLPLKEAWSKEQVNKKIHKLLKNQQREAQKKMSKFLLVKSRWI